MPNEKADVPHVLDDPPPFHRKLLDYGERPYWSADGTRIAFIETNYGDACELDVETGKVRNLTRDLGQHHSFLRVLFLSNGDYLLIGPRTFKDRDTSRHVESELWVMDKNASRPPKPLGRRMFEGAGVSTIAPRITYAVCGRNDPSLGDPDVFECHVTDIAYGEDGPELGADRAFYRTRGSLRPEPQDFRHDDSEVIFAEYVRGGPPHPRCVVKGCRLDTGEFTTYVDEANVHNECEGIFPDHDYICLESSCDTDWPMYPPRDLWKLKLDGSQQRVRMTSMPADHTWKATNSNVSPDGRWLAFMVGLRADEAGFGRGLGLLDLAAWQETPEAQKWETPSDRARENAAKFVGAPLS
ncbi:PD40 domain-containing protein [Actinopolymorpha pittospori]|uniref:Tol biopolymer transport system component n=1 Tax=Actinopolymorpha pittospori TaxID=648752 RepID=A0A927MZC1_9ACTN|nr:PD40 domain-containing protein [Actinopolymorpha pittospori]MBE1609339.1 Tol biopolymer transport system component [Actinopolymorpha pittospori]